MLEIGLEQGSLPVSETFKTRPPLVTRFVPTILVPAWNTISSTAAFKPEMGKPVLYSPG